MIFCRGWVLLFGPVNLDDDTPADPAGQSRYASFDNRADGEPLWPELCRTGQNLG